MPIQAGFPSPATAATVSVAAVFLTIRVATPEDLWIIVPALVLGVLAVFLSARSSLSITDTFPELARIGFLRRILG